jgi:hypothetical protein
MSNLVDVPKPLSILSALARVGVVQVAARTEAAPSPAASPSPNSNPRMSRTLIHSWRKTAATLAL